MASHVLTVLALFVASAVGGECTRQRIKSLAYLNLLRFSPSPSADPMSARFLSCQQDSLTKCTDPLKVLTNNRDLGFAASQQELNALCP